MNTRTRLPDSKPTKFQQWAGWGIIAVLLTLLLIPVPVVKPLRVGTTGDYAPFSARGEDSQLYGTDIIQARNLSYFLRRPLIFIPTTWQTWLQDLKDNRFDIAMSGINATTERGQSVWLSAPYRTGHKVLVGQCQLIHSMPTLEHINSDQYHIVTNAGGTNQFVVEQKFPAAQNSFLEDNTRLLSYLNKHANVLVVTDDVEAELFEKKNRTLCIYPSPVHSIKFVYAVGKHNTDLQEKISLWLSGASQLPTKKPFKSN